MPALSGRPNPNPNPNPNPQFHTQHTPSTAEHFASGRPPKVMLTTSYKPTKIMYTFLSEMLVRTAPLRTATAAALRVFSRSAGCMQFENHVIISSRSVQAMQCAKSNPLTLNAVTQE